MDNLSPPEGASQTPQHPLPPSLPPSDGRLANALGYSGLLPMLAAIAGMLIESEQQQELLRLSNIYVGTILCFLGGIQWGLALGGHQEDGAVKQLSVSVAPSLWTMAMLWIGGAGASLGLAMGLIALLLYELREHRLGHYAHLPSWYLPLRRNLTLALTGSILLLALLALGSTKA